MFSPDPDDDLFDRIKAYVANDLNSKVPAKNNPPLIDVNDVYIIAFTRVTNNWRCLASSYQADNIFYELVHDANSGATISKVSKLVQTTPAII